MYFWFIETKSDLILTSYNLFIIKHLFDFFIKNHYDTFRINPNLINFSGKYNIFL